MLVRAESAIANSLSLLQGKKSPQIIAAVLNAKGNLELGLGKSAKAVETWQETAGYYRQAGDMQGVIGTQINQAQALQALGMYRSAMQKTLKAAITFLENQPPSGVKLMGLLR
ncbi:MAG: hypothetical protein EBE86_030945 [Hormoscilla sp. GUM202]|nr:hypothetical protein [Hormoscilla sp. GUM202]